MTYYPEYKLTRYPDGIAMKRSYYDILKFQFDSDNDLTFYESHHGWIFRKMRNSEWGNEVSAKVYNLFYEEADYSKQEKAFAAKYKWQRLLPYSGMYWWRQLLVVIFILGLFLFFGAMYRPFKIYNLNKRELENLKLEMSQNDPSQNATYYQVVYQSDVDNKIKKEGADVDGVVRFAFVEYEYCPVEEYKQKSEAGEIYSGNEDAVYYKLYGGGFVDGYKDYVPVKDYNAKTQQLKSELASAEKGKKRAYIILIAYGALILLYNLRRPVRKS